MKKILFLLLCFFALKANSQVIDTTINYVAAVKIQPFKAKFNDSTNVTHLSVQITGDNLKNWCGLKWAVMDSMQRVSVEGYAVINGADYANWTGSNLYPFVFIGKLYNITFLK
jgi:hypothetical protein